MRSAVALGLAALALAVAVQLGERAQAWNDELALLSPLARMPPRLDDPHTPRLARRVILVVIDGLGAGESALPYLATLRARGAAAVASVPYPTISRPSYVTILTGVPPADSGVRTNRVRAAVPLDTIMDRVQAAGLRVATASDYGSLATLFLRHAIAIGDVAWRESGTRFAPPPPITWPFDEAHRVGSLAELAPVLAALARSDAAFVPVLVLDVDRAGHAAGVGAAYRAAAAAVDRMLATALADVDLTRDTVIVTADHGHVAPGGHGGIEPEVSHVPLVLAGAGIAPAAAPDDVRLVDLAPTVAALLGVPAPGHAEGRTLVELLQLSPAEAARRAEADAARTDEVLRVMAAARAADRGVDAERLLWLGAALAAGLAALGALVRRRAIAVPRGASAAWLGFAGVLVAVVAMTRGHLSPSYVPTLARVELYGALGAGLALGAQVVASALVIRRARDRVAAASGLAVVGLGGPLACVIAVRAWYAPPFLTPPPPGWLVGLPALDLATATGALGCAITLGYAALSSRGARRRP